MFFKVPTGRRSLVWKLSTDICTETGNFYPSAPKRSVKFPNLKNYIFAIFVNETLPVGFCIYFKVLFPTASIDRW